VNARTRKYYDWISTHACLKCGSTPVEIAHIRAFRSPKTDLLLGRREGIGELAVIPLCTACHRVSLDSIHAVGETEFEASIGKGEKYLTQKAASLIAEYYLS
jgi:hypothetical protein